MAVRIVVVLVVLGIAGYAFYTNQQAKEWDKAQATLDSETPRDYSLQKPKFEKEGVDLEGIEPEGAPDFHVATRLRMEGPRPVLTFTITEAHGWYADYLYVEFWYQEQNDDGEWQHVGDSIKYMCRHYLDFGATLVEETTPMLIEFPDIPEDFGASENWVAHVSDWRKVLAPKS